MKETETFQREVAQLEAQARFGKEGLQWCLVEVRRLKVVQDKFRERVGREHMRFAQLFDSLIAGVNGVMGVVKEKATLSCGIVERQHDFFGATMHDELSERARRVDTRQLLLSLKRDVTSLEFLTWGVKTHAPVLEEKVERILAGDAAEDDKELWIEAEAEVEALLKKRRATLELQEILASNPYISPTTQNGTTM